MAWKRVKQSRWDRHVPIKRQISRYNRQNRWQRRRKGNLKGLSGRHLARPRHKQGTQKMRRALGTVRSPLVQSLRWQSDLFGAPKKRYAAGRANRPTGVVTCAIRIVRQDRREMPTGQIHRRRHSRELFSNLPAWGEALWLDEAVNRTNLSPWIASLLPKTVLLESGRRHKLPVLVPHAQWSV